MPQWKHQSITTRPQPKHDETGDEHEGDLEATWSTDSDNEAMEVSEPIHIDIGDMTRNYAGVMLECQQFYSGFEPPKSPTPPPGIEITTQSTITRAQAIEMIEPYLTRARQEKFQASVDDELTKRLKKEIVQVMDADTKVWLRFWATMTDKPDVLEWVNDAKEDKEAVEYAEIRTLPGPPMWSSTNPGYTIIQDLLDYASDPRVPAAVGEKIRMATYAINHYVKTMETKHRVWANAEAMEKLDTVINAIRDEGNKTRDMVKGGKRTHEEAFQN
ncbi:hypothetical protein V8C35DRAFT_329374 [Trichoderma chlorosporum]